MFSVQELRFAQKYPFSKTARRVVEESGFSLDNVPREVLNRARAMVSAAYTGREYRPRIEASSELLCNEILAFPAAKIIVSIIDRLELYRKFSGLFGNVVFANLEQEKDEVLIDMAHEFGFTIRLGDSPYFAEMSVADYLKPELDESSMKLVNSDVEKGIVFLNRTDFARLLSLSAAQELRGSLPVELKKIPREFRAAAEETETEFSGALRKAFSKADFGAVSPEAFPPCMAKIYTDLMSGVNVNHSGRFAIAAFLASIGMGAESIVDAFRSTPNFSEKVTRYQVERIAGVRGKSYSSPSCDKMRSYNLCVANCPVTHPVQFYSREKNRSGKSRAE